MRSTLQLCASAASSAQPVKQRSAPHPRLPPHLLPVATGRRDSRRFRQSAALHACDDASLPSPRRHGEKGPACVFISMQPCIPATAPASLRPAQRGEGGAAAPDEGPWEVGRVRHAAVHEPDFIGGCTKSTKAPLIRGCRRTFSPSERGEGTGMRFFQIATSHSCENVSCPFSPWRRGEGAAAAADEGRFRASSATADEAALAHGCSGDLSPPPTSPNPVLPHHPGSSPGQALPRCSGQREGGRVRKNAMLQSGENACWSLLPRAKAQAAERAPLYMGRRGCPGMGGAGLARLAIPEVACLRLNRRTR